jgi:hypothetical protein
VLDTRVVADGTHQLTAVAEDAGGNQASAPRALVVDNTAPAAPLDVVVIGPADVPPPTQYSLAWRNPPGQVAPIAAAHWALCLGAAKGLCLTGSRQSTFGGELGRTGSLGPLERGEWQAYLWLEDAAGNVDPAHSAGPLRLSVVAGAGLKNPRLKILRVRRRGNRLSVKGVASAKTGRVQVSVERRLHGHTHLVRGRATIRKGRWTKRLRLRGRLAEVRRTTLVVRFAAKDGYKAQTLRRQVRR